jgi:hypothetical protein
LGKGGLGEKNVPWGEDVSVEIDSGKEKGGHREKMFPPRRRFLGDG